MLSKRELGRGSSGIVFEVEDVERGVTLALKSLRSVTPAAVLQLKREFRALSDVTHDNLVLLHELFCEGPEWFFTMELVDGAPLVVKHAPSEPPAAAALVERFTQLAHGICALHARGILHRDLKPGNVLLTARGRVVILDFGLMRRLDDEATLRREGTSFSGTLSYVAPEQVLSHQLTTACDWYSFGSMLYEALSGQQPFSGHARRLLSEKLAGPRALPEALRDQPLARLCLDLLAPAPERRPSAEQVLACLGGPAAVVSLAPSSLRSQPAPLIGREDELEQLTRAMQRRPEAPTRLVLVGGPSGVGKTSLVRGALRALSD
ncbi:MAG: protein kinase [Polyangiaceae bacterium]